MIYQKKSLIYWSLHLLSRRMGDVENPICGSWNVIPGNGGYKSTYH